MIISRTQLFFIVVFGAALISAANAQSPTPIVVQAATSLPQQAVPPPAKDSRTLNEALKLLQEIRVGNQETLKKQQDALEQLDALQKAAQQIKIFTRRTTG